MSTSFARKNYLDNFKFLILAEWLVGTQVGAAATLRTTHR
jgi:hypothetical protein